MSRHKLNRTVWSFLQEMRKTHVLSAQESKLVSKSFREGYKAAKEEFKQPKPIFKKPTAKLVDDMKCLMGIPPHDGGSNYVKGDGYFSKDLNRRIRNQGCDWDEVVEMAKAEGRLMKPSWDT